ncbi:MAG: ATP-binding protein, partial [Dehalococcoidales bacterium]|nr:ATP-binding protein [Dehalococcoidales bacterium]
KPTKELVDINTVLKNTIDLRAYQMRISNITAEQHLSPNLPRTYANSGQLQQVFLNMVINAEHAVAAAHNSGQITVKTAALNDHIRVSITDNGIGIPPENMNKLFDPFFTTKGDHGGTGLGLSISYGIIKEHHGKITVNSRPGEYTTFVIDLPIVVNDEEMEQIKNSLKPAKAPSPKTEKRILVIDDESNICRVLYRLLSSAGYQVDTISDARAAIIQLKGVTYDLILLDIKMPGMNGIQFYEHLKAIDTSLPNKVICLTGDVISLQNQTFFEKMSVPYITKPFDIQDLIEKVKHNLGGNDAEETSADCR